MAVQLIISMDDNGQVGVNGPIDNQVLAYGLLMIAHNAIYDYHKQKENRITPATLIPPTIKSGL